MCGNWRRARRHFDCRLPNRVRATASIANAKLAANANPVDPVVKTIGWLQKLGAQSEPRRSACCDKDPVPRKPLLDSACQECHPSGSFGCGVRRVSPEDASRAQQLEEARLARAVAKASSPKTTS